MKASDAHAEVQVDARPPDNLEEKKKKENAEGSFFVALLSHHHGGWNKRDNPSKLECRQQQSEKKTGCLFCYDFSSPCQLFDQFEKCSIHWMKSSQIMLS